MDRIQSTNWNLYAPVLETPILFMTILESRKEDVDFLIFRIWIQISNYATLKLCISGIDLQNY